MATLSRHQAFDYLKPQSRQKRQFRIENEFEIQIAVAMLPGSPVNCMNIDEKLTIALSLSELLIASAVFRSGPRLLVCRVLVCVHVVRDGRDCRVLGLVSKSSSEKRSLCLVRGIDPPFLRVWKGRSL